jgi:hypothetical protein
MATPIPVGAFHVSRQVLARTLDFQEVARNNVQMDSALFSATAMAEGYLHRSFFPWYGTRYFDWPARENPVSYRIRFDDNELISLTAASAGGTALDPTALLPYPSHGPPYTWVETSLGGNDVFGAGDTHQDAVALTGYWGYRRDTQAIGTLVATITNSQTTLVVSDSSQIGVGNVILVDSEYMVVRRVSSLTSGQTLQTPLLASAAGTAVAVSTGSAFFVGEVVTLDAEQMLILDITGNSLLVKRAWNGTVLATHTGSTIYVPRTLTVDRAACSSAEQDYPGLLYPAVDLYPSATTPAAAHTAGATIALHVVPPAVQALCLAEASWLYMNHAQGWQVAPGTTTRATTQLAGLAILNDLRANAMRAVGRKGRQRTV